MGHGRAYLADLPRVGCMCALLGAGLVTCMHCKGSLGAARCMKPAVSQQEHRRRDVAHSATRPAFPGTRQALRQTTSLHIWRRPGRTLLLQPITAALMLSFIVVKALVACILIVSSAGECLTAVHPAFPALAQQALPHLAPAWSHT